LGTAGKVNISAAMFSLAQAIAGRAFVGPNFREELGQAFWRDYEAISRSIDPILPPDLPLPKFVRRDRAKLRMRALMGPIIARRRAHPDRYDDVITQLITTPLKDGSFMTDEELVTLFIGLLFAGHETTAGQAGWLIVLLLQHPDYLRLVQGEIAEHVTAAMDPRALSKLKHIYWAIDETTRLRPSADMQMRMVKAPVQLDRYVVPEGWGMCVNAAVTHHLEEVYTQPEAFDPLRFSPERDEGRGTFDSVGFGGGIHKCTGMNFAKNEMAVITMLLFGQFDLELITPQVEIVRGLGANRPSEALVRYKRK
jgi:sterol 14-demethylase